MSTISSRLGVDVGRVYLKGVRLDEGGRIAASFCAPHRGDPARLWTEMLRSLAAAEHDPVALTGAACRRLAEVLGVTPRDLVRCQVAGVGVLVPGARQIIDIGGSSATLIDLDADGCFQSYATNSLCAAGTGSFLDEQAARLGIRHGEMAGMVRVHEPPSIATRCAVFAKSDLIHRQQEGYSKAEMWSGLCRGMTRTLLGTLLHGRPLAGPTAIIGGVALNREVVRWLEEAHPGLLRVPSAPHLIAAYGAALEAASVLRPLTSAASATTKGLEEADLYDWSLRLERSVYPSFAVAESYSDDRGNEVRVSRWPASAVVTGTLGIDIGSTSTKLALIDTDEAVLVDIYRKTAGDPLGATRALLAALSALAARRGARLDIRGVGTTGSGRKMVGTVLGADAVINEISAHVAGAVKTDPSVDTIFEIGGQDSKYMHVVGGHIRDANMNYVCAAGTGSFVEEQANKLGYPVCDVGAAVLGRRPPRTSDRCTVFMAEDVGRLAQAGTAPETALAGVMVSVVKNYLNKVVGNRYWNRDKIFFQGATARNPALVAAFERVLGVEVVVSPYCHVMGAYGVALLTQRALAARGERSRFRGLDLERRSIAIRTEPCELCNNRCRISIADIEGEAEKPSWGYLCGRDPEERRLRVNPHARLLRKREALWRRAGGGVTVPETAPVIGIPQALVAYTYLPLWRRFFNRLGFRIELSGESDRAIREAAVRLSGADFCFPAKIVQGHVAALVERNGVDFVFLPHMVSEELNPHTTAAHFCPYVQAAPSYVRSALELNGLGAGRLLSPVVDLRRSEPQVVEELVKGLAPLGCTPRAVRAAWREAIAVQRQFQAQLVAEGRRAQAEAFAAGERIILLVGRPYNLYDSGLNLDLPQKIADRGRLVVPVDMLDSSLERLGDRYRNTYWSYGQRILAALEEAAVGERTDVVYLTNFNCGPDSFLLSYAEEILGSRPFLALELDEHDADAGYLTRIEAYFDVLARPRAARGGRRPYAPEAQDLRGRTIWIPPMHAAGAELFAAAFRRHGFDARPLPPEDKETFELGRRLTRGSECLPTALTIGALIKAVGEGSDAGRHAFMMPTAEGPCRFGQYCTLHRQILDRAGLRGLTILAPSSQNSYQGLSEPMRRTLWLAMLAADVLLKAALKVRPYEIVAGETDRVLEREKQHLSAVLAAGGDLWEAVRVAVAAFASIRTARRFKPLVGVVGEIYVRSNPFANEDVLGAVERFGGEAWMVPSSEWILYTAATRKHVRHGWAANPLKKWLMGLRDLYIFSREHRMYEAAGPFLADRREPPIEEVLAEGLERFPLNFGGEAVLTVGRTVKFAHQGAAMVINCAPFGCMPGAITTAVFRGLAARIDMPIVNLFYDGTGGQNERLEVFLKNLAAPSRSAAEREAAVG